MLQFFSKRKSERELVRLQGHKEWVCGLRAHPNGELLVSCGYDRTIRLFSSVTGKCLRVFTGHQGTVWRVIFADPNTVLSASDDKTVRTWNIARESLANRTTNVIEFDDFVWIVEKIGANMFACGTRYGKVQIHEREGNKLPIRHCFQAHEDGINCIASWRDRFGTASLDRTARIWDTNTFECLATLSGHEHTCRAISMSESFIATSSFDTVIILYDAINFNVLHRITTHQGYIRCIQFVGPEEHLLSSGDDKTVRIHNSLTGDLLWTKELVEPATCSAVLKDGRLATGLKSGDIVVYQTPASVSSHIKPLNACRSLQSSVRAHPLHDALLSCVSGYSSPRDHCDKLIRYEASRVSYDEWCSAHRILMLAVEDGDVLPNTEFNNEHSWWYDNLYLAVRDIELTTHQYLQVKRYLTEAKNRRVLECAEAVLTALHVTRDVRKNTRMMERAGTLILERILRMEDQLTELKKAYNRYVSFQRKSQLVGIALQVIPIAGGAVAGALSAGSEIVKGLSVKDVTDYALGIGSNVAQSQIDEEGDRILRQAAESLSPTSLESMDQCRREKLEDALRFCGIDVTVLHQVFLRRIKDDGILQTNEKGINGGVELHDPCSLEENLDDSAAVKHENPLEEEYETEEDKVTPCSYEEVITHAPVTSEECNPCIEVGNPAKFENRGQNMIPGNSPKHCDGFTMSITELKQVDISARTIAELSQDSIAQLWSAYVCRFDERENENFCALAECFSSALKHNEMHGSELVDRRLLSVFDIMNTVEESLERGGKEITLGQRARMKRFLLDISSSTCSCQGASQ